MKFEVFQNKENKQFFFHLRANNNKVVLQSEGYANKKDALDTIRTIRWGAFFARVIDLVCS